jgi:Tfp pilus assembly protein PilF
LLQIKAQESFLRNDLQLSLLNSKQALSFDPKNLEASLVLGIVYLELAQRKEAEELYNTCLTAETFKVMEQDGDSKSIRRAWVLTHR